ncbi:MAG: hypothetical protein HY744_01965 [Deltaproteobacteria bacterium]|nr:hypothetical protein [Deltaproteobacteria bacterium]
MISARLVARLGAALLPALLVAGCQSHRPAPVAPWYGPGPGPGPAPPPEPFAPAPTPFASPPPPPGGRACGRLPHEPVRPLRWEWSGTNLGPASCDQAETVWGNVPHEHRACQADADCVVVSGNGGCFNAALTRAAASLPDYQQLPCGNPAAGACAAAPRRAVCAAGCCEEGPGP